MSHLIVMLTQNDKTVSNPISILSKCKSLDVEYWGIKTEPLPKEEMKNWVAQVHQFGKKAVFESVTYTEEKGLRDIELAIYCKCDMLMGTTFSHKINSLCKENGIKYLPFVGKPSEVPSILEGDANLILSQIEMYKSCGAFGVDFLAYRHIENPQPIIKSVLENSNGFPICIAGSVDSKEKIEEIKNLNCEYFTIGSAFFENKFNGTFEKQIETVISYLQ